MSGCAKDSQGKSQEPSWLEVGKKSAVAYASHEDWLFRRVETIDFVERNSVKRSISVDFEIPRDLPDLGNRGASDTKLVPISVYRTWPPLMDFSFVGPKGHPTSLYLRTTNDELDLGLLLGMADRALSACGCRHWQGRARRFVDDGWRCDCRRLSPRLVRDLKAVVEDRNPSKEDVEHATNELRAELKKKLGEQLEHQRMEDREDLITQIGATVDLAGRLSDGSVLWVAVAGRPGTDRIVKFSYRESLKSKHSRMRRAAIACSWTWRNLHIPLTHTGRYVRFHLDIRVPQGSIELADVEPKALPHATVDPGATEAKMTSVQNLARKYPEEFNAPDEWIGPESSRVYLSYGEPVTLARDSPPRRRIRLQVPLFGPRRPDRGEDKRISHDGDSSVEVVDGRAHVYLGASSTPSHRVWLQVKLGAPRDGFVKGCMITAIAVALLMTAGYLCVSSAADHLEAAVVLLSIVPVVLGYILVRPGEQALERHHITGVRAIVLLAGAMPIVGALALVFTHGHARGVSPVPPDLAVARPIWLVLAILSWVAAAALLVSWYQAVPSRASAGRARAAIPSK